VSLGDHRIGVVERAEVGIDVAIVGDVVAAVEQRRGIPRTDPEGVDAELGEITEPRPDAVDVADAVAVRVGERPRVDLVDDGAAPPLVCHEPDSGTPRPIWAATASTRPR
jgi:hypothetical protein